jgi:hypothetical protein
MGKSKKPLSMLVSDELATEALIQKYTAQGFDVWTFTRYSQGAQRTSPTLPWLEEFDVILGPTCYMTPVGMEECVIELSVKAAREKRYGK